MSSIQSRTTVETRDTVREQVVVTVIDTIKEMTTITIRENEAGDTLRLTQVTDRERVRSMSDVRSKREDVYVRTDTVYIEQDSIAVKEIPHQVRNEGTGGLLGGGATGRQGLIAGLTRNLRWLFFVLLAIIAIIIIIRLKLFK